MTKVKTLIISEETGELIETIQTGDSIKITRQEQKDYARKHDIQFNSKEDFIKFFIKNTDKMADNLNFAELGLLLSLTKFICYEDCILRTGGRHNGNVLTVKELAVLLKQNEKSLYRQITNLKSKGVLCICGIGSIYEHEHNKKVIIINPYIFCRGNIVNNTIKALFENSGWQ
jgi:hypothetical protein